MNPRWVLAALLVLGACASAPGGFDGRLLAVPPPAGLASAVRARVGNDFALGRYPEGARTVEDVYRFLATEHSARTLPNRWERVYATQVAITLEGLTGPVYVFAANREFGGDIVYAVSIAYPAHPRVIYVRRAR
jgi:hypothetical protein